MKFGVFTFLFFFTIISLHAQSPIVEWQKCLGGSGYESPGSLIQLRDSNYLVVGNTGSNDGNVTLNHGLKDFWVIKTDQNGNIIWQRCYGGSHNDMAIRVVETNNNRLLVTGFSASWDGDVSGNHSAITHYDAWAIMLDNQGNLLWQKCYGGTGDEFMYQTMETSDSSFILVGSTTSNDFDVSGNHSQDTSDVWIIKIDSVGNLIWQKCLGGTNEDIAFSVIASYGDGFIVIGETKSNNGDISFLHDSLGNYQDIWVVKISSSGDIDWEKTFGGSAVETGWDVCKDTGFSYTILGHTTSHDGDISSNHAINYTYDMWLLNIDSTGNLQWEKCFGGSASEFGYSFIRSNDGYILAGLTISIDGDVSGLHTQNGYDNWIIGIDSLRNIEWNRCYGGTQDEYFSSIIKTFDQGYIISSSTSSNNGDVSGHHNPNYATDFWLLKISSPYVSITEASSHPQFITNYFTEDKTLHVIFNSHTEKNGTLQILDITGKIIFVKSINSKIGKNEFDFQIGSLSKGIYIVRLLGDNEIITSKVYY